VKAAKKFLEEQSEEMKKLYSESQSANSHVPIGKVLISKFLGKGWPPSLIISGKE
jgi:hypothetical protein